MTVEPICQNLHPIYNVSVFLLIQLFGQTKFGKKYGRRRFFLLLCIPLVLTYMLLWIPHRSFIYYLVTYLFFEVVYTCVMIPYETLAIEMTNDFQLRTELASSKAVFGKIAAFIGAALPGIYLAILGQHTPLPFFMTAATYSFLMMASLIFFYKNSWETTAVDCEKLAEKKPFLFKELYSIFKLRIFRILLGMYLFSFDAEALLTSIFTYYIIFALERPSTLVSILNSVNSVVQFVSILAFIKWSFRKGSNRTFESAVFFVLIEISFLVAAYFVNGSFLMLLLFGATLFLGIGSGGIYYIPWTLYVFLADIDEIKSGRRREGIYAGAMTMSGKILRAVILFVIGNILELAHFKKEAVHQPPSTIYALMGILIIGISGMLLISLLFTRKMTLSQGAHQTIMNELTRIKHGGKSNLASQEVQKLVENLTGESYQSCFLNVQKKMKHM